MDETKTIIMEHKDNLLVRVDSSVLLGDKEYKTLSYEIWTDRDKFENNIVDEWKEDGQHLYCSNYATTDEEDMIRTFKQRFMSYFKEERKGIIYVCESSNCQDDTFFTIISSHMCFLKLMQILIQHCLLVLFVGRRTIYTSTQEVCLKLQKC